MEELTEEEWDKVVSVNAKGQFLGMKYVLPTMKKAEKDSVVNISSVAGIVAFDSALAAYSVSKGFEATDKGSCYGACKVQH